MGSSSCLLRTLRSGGEGTGLGLGQSASLWDLQQVCLHLDFLSLRCKPRALTLAIFHSFLLTFLLWC